MVLGPNIRIGRPFGSASFEPESARAFGAVLRHHRTVKGVSQEALAHLASMERAHIGRIERGENQPSLGIVLKLADALGCDAGQLVSETVQVIKNETPASSAR
nr:helix-turn-helix transcriptional regulator [uncultured Rhodoferax sp.]